MKLNFHHFSFYKKLKLINLQYPMDQTLLKFRERERERAPVRERDEREWAWKTRIRSPMEIQKIGGRIRDSKSDCLFHGPFSGLRFWENDIK